jgi:hypothetical protein
MRSLSILALLILACTMFGQSLPNEVKAPIGTATVLGPDASGAVKVVGAAQSGVTLSPGTLTVNGQTVAVVVASGGGGPDVPPLPPPPPENDPKLKEFEDAFNADASPDKKPLASKMSERYALAAAKIRAGDAKGFTGEQLRELLKNLTVDLLLGDKLGAVRHLIAFLLAEVLPSDLKATLTPGNLDAAAKQFERVAKLLDRLGK